MNAYPRIVAMSDRNRRYKKTAGVQMELFFLRHGPAEPKDNWAGDDEERPLSAAGELLVAEVAATLARQHVAPDLILTSPYRRARQTAYIVAERLGMSDRVKVDSRLMPGFGVKQLGKILHDYSDRQSLLLVGHGPDLGQVVRNLTGGRLTIRKAGVAQVEVMEPAAIKGRLLSLLVPAPIEPEDESAGEQA